MEVSSGAGSAVEAPAARAAMLDPHSDIRDNCFYARDDVARRYEQSRVLPPDVERDWSGLLARHVGSRPALSVDLGCGTGRFTRVLAQTFGGRVVGIDPSRAMLRVAAEGLRGTPGVTLLQGRAEQVPLAAGCAGLVLMSMSYHHVMEKAAALASIRHTLRPGGVFCVRTCTREALESYLYQRFFPEARAFDEQRFPSRQDLKGDASAAGLALRQFETVSQRVADSLASYRDKAATRAHSDLLAITDDQFAAGMRRLDGWLATQAERPVYEEVDLFTFSAV